MNKIKYFILIISFIFINNITAQEGKITVDSSQNIKNLITKKIAYNKSNVKRGYRIQLFYGSENGAIKTQNKFREIFPNTSCSLEFDSPNWKIKVGNYKTRLIADKHLQEIITEFGDAIVIEPKKK